MLAGPVHVLEHQPELAAGHRHAGLRELAVRAFAVEEPRVEVEAVGAEELRVITEKIAAEHDLVLVHPLGEALARLLRRAGGREVIDDPLQEEWVPAAAHRLGEELVGQLALEARDARLTRIGRGAVVHEGATVEIGTLVGVGQTEVDCRCVGRMGLAGEELLAPLDDRLVRRRIVAPRLPGACQEADDVEHAEGLGRPDAVRAQLRGRVDGGPPVHASAEENVAGDVAAVATLGLAHRLERIVVGAGEDGGGVASHGGVAVGDLRERRPPRVAMAGQVPRHRDHVVRRGVERTLRMVALEATRRLDHHPRFAEQGCHRDLVVVARLGSGPWLRRPIDGPPAGLLPGAMRGHVLRQAL